MGRAGVWSRETDKLFFGFGWENTAKIGQVPKGVKDGDGGHNNTKLNMKPKTRKVVGEVAILINSKGKKEASKTGN